MNLNSREVLIERLRRSPAAREQFVDSHLGKGIAHQLRATRDRRGWNQQQLADASGMAQNAISRLESPGYGKPTITTLKRLAAAMDVGLIIRFVPFSQMVDWVSGTARVDRGLSATALGVPSFGEEYATGVLGAEAPGRANLTNAGTGQDEAGVRNSRVSTSGSRQSLQGVIGGMYSQNPYAGGGVTPHQ